MLPNLLLRDHNPNEGGATMFHQLHNTDMSNGTYAIWTGNGGYFAGAFGGGKDFRSDPMMAVEYDTKYEAEQAAEDKLGMDPEEYDVRQIT